MSMQSLINRLQYNGGDSLGRINKQKLRSFQSALKNDYNSRLIKTPKKVACHALINTNNLKPDYDKKIISVEFDAGLESGDVFEILDDHSTWMVYLPILTETAYLRAEIIRCRYTLDIGNETYWVYFQGPTETDVKWYIKQNTNFNELNLSGTIYIKNTPETKEFFKRFTKIKLDGHTWEVQVTDSITVPGIIELEIQEFYDNTPAELPEIKKISDTAIIMGADSVKQNTIVGYKVSADYYDENAEWKITGNDRVFIKNVFENGRMCEVEIAPGAIRKFYIQYGKLEPLCVHIDISESHIIGPEVIYPYDKVVYTTDNDTDMVTFYSDSDLVKIKQLTNNSCQVTVTTGKSGHFVLKASGDKADYLTEITIGSF